MPIGTSSETAKPNGIDPQAWLTDVLSRIAGHCDLGDARLNRRLGAVLEAIGERPGKSLPPDPDEEAAALSRPRLPGGRQ